MIESIKV